MAIALKNALVKDNSAFSAHNLKSLTEETLLSWFDNAIPPPNIYERLLRLQELGCALEQSNQYVFLQQNGILLKHFSRI